jgi:5'(3')-deoxyribonucleotidase
MVQPSALQLPVGRRPILAVDMDEVIADALAEHLFRYNRDFQTTLTLDDLHGRYLWDLIPPERHHALAGYMLSDDFFSVLTVMPEAQRVLARMQSRFDIFIATAAMEVPTSFTAKFHWLATHFPFIAPSHIVFCGDKSILRADFLIDDNPRQLSRFEARAHQISDAAFHPQGILLSAPANVNVLGYRRVANWREVETLFLGTEE